jgi:DNA-directed RNA polymerase subunit alpha
VKIEGVQHEFSTLEGVVEDVTEIILNLKEVNIRLLEGDEKVIHVKKEGQGELKASDLQVDAQIEVMNPDQHIAGLDRDGVLDMEITIGVGRGYVLSDSNKTAEQPMGTIVLDAAFTPVRKIHYQVDNARVGQQTDYDMLTLEIWTNGVVRPDDSVAQAAKILKDHLELFINFDEEPEEEIDEVVDEATQRIGQLLEMQVDELELSVRSANCLKAADIVTLRDLVMRPESEMLKFRNFGRKSLNELNAILENLDLSFGMEIGKFQDVAPKAKPMALAEEDF